MKLKNNGIIYRYLLIDFSECARFHGVNYKTFHSGLTLRRGMFDRRIPMQKVLRQEEGIMVVRHVLYKASIEYGESWTTLRLLLQHVLNRIKSANPTRLTGLEDRGHLPSISWVRRFAERHDLTLRKASIISKGRAVISPQDITLVQRYRTVFHLLPRN